MTVDQTTVVEPAVHDVPTIVDGRAEPALDGEWYPIVNPATARVIARVPAGKAADVRRAVDAASRAFSDGPWPRMSGSARAVVMNRFAELLAAHHEELSQLEARNNGRPIVETRAQLGVLPEHFRYHAGLAITARGETVPVGDGYLAYLQHVPIGVVAVMTPFNHPLLIAARGIAPAIAAGNTVVVKPSEHTPLTTLRMVELAAEAGFPEGVINVVTGIGIEAGAALVEHPAIARIEFTGGVETGRRIAVAAASRFGTASTELGGKAPFVVFDDADVADAAKGAAFAGLIASGQTCIAGTRILVQESIRDEFTEELLRLVRDIRIGDPLDERTNMGPVINAAARDRTLDYVASGVEEGATLLAGGGRPEVSERLRDGFWVQPTVFGDARPELRICREEIFGPVITIDTFSGETDGIAKANDSRFGLGAGVWTRDIARGHRVAQQITAGMVWINDHHRLSAAMPWGGFKDSGTGRQAGIEAYRNMTAVKTVILRTAPGAPEWFANGDSRLN